MYETVIYFSQGYLMAIAVIRVVFGAGMSVYICSIYRFGVCCVFMVSTCGSTISQNCSYIKNPGFPTAYTSTTQCSYTIQKCDSCKYSQKYGNGAQEYTSSNSVRYNNIIKLPFTWILSKQVTKKGLSNFQPFVIFVLILNLSIFTDLLLH